MQTKMQGRNASSYDAPKNAKHAKTKCKEKMQKHRMQRDNASENAKKCKKTWFGKPLFKPKIIS